MRIALMLGSAPNALQARDWPRAPFDHIVAINNAWRIRDDWDDLCCPWDFPQDRRPVPGATQRLILQEDFVPTQNLYGGFVYAGGTMAFTTAYWMLAALKPDVLAVLGCDMHYPAQGQTHFYGTGTADPLRPDITLRSLESKSARLMILAAQQGCAMVNLSTGPSRLVFPRATPAHLAATRPAPFDQTLTQAALDHEAELGYQVASGRYWEESHRFDVTEIDQLDALWLRAAKVA
jgi:hypothetical protein